jgi:hypothetical protein
VNFIGVDLSQYMLEKAQSYILDNGIAAFKPNEFGVLAKNYLGDRVDVRKTEPVDFMVAVKSKHHVSAVC